MKFLISIADCRINRTLLLFGFLQALAVSVLFGQTSSVSPYSRYGIGEIKSQGLSHHRSAGGIGTAWDDQGHINTINSATLAFDTITIFEVGLDAEWVQLSSSNSSSNASSGTLGYFSLAFPVIKNKWSSAIGLQPVSSTGYNVTINDNYEGIENIKYIYEGKGGFSKFYFNNGVKLHPNLSIGLSASFMFGTIDYQKSVEFPTNEDYFNSRYIEGITANDFQFDAGLFYTKNLKNQNKLSFGAVAAIPTKLSARQNVYWFNYTKNIFGFEIIKDSVQTLSDNSGEIILPMYYRFGVMYSKANNWRLGADFNYTDWTNFEKFGVKDSLANSYSLHMGGEYSKEKFSFRAGGYYEKSFLDLRGQQLTDMGFTFGISIVKLFSIKPPVNINFAFMLGQRGTEESDLIKEQYTRFTFGLTISDIWFMKPKYD